MIGSKLEELLLARFTSTLVPEVKEAIGKTCKTIFGLASSCTGVSSAMILAIRSVRNSFILSANDSEAINAERISFTSSWNFPALLREKKRELFFKYHHMMRIPAFRNSNHNYRTIWKSIYCLCL